MESILLQTNESGRSKDFLKSIFDFEWEARENRFNQIMGHARLVNNIRHICNLHLKYDLLLLGPFAWRRGCAIV